MTFSVAVIVPTFNTRGTLARALNSIYNQTEAPDEIWVVDDGSTDGTSEWVKKNHHRVHLLSQIHGGPGKARNLGIKSCHSEWVSFLDADDEWLPNKLAIQKKAIRVQPDFDVIFTNGCFASSSRLKATIRNGITKILCRRQSCQPDSLSKNAIEAITIKEINAEGVLSGETSPSASAFGRRQVFYEADGYHESLGQGEDWDLWMRLLMNGYRLGKIAPELYKIHVSDTSMRSYNYSKATFTFLKFIQTWDPTVNLNNRSLLSKEAYSRIIDKYYKRHAVGALYQGNTKLARNLLNSRKEIGIYSGSPDIALLFALSKIPSPYSSWLLKITSHLKLIRTLQ